MSVRPSLRAFHLLLFGATSLGMNVFCAPPLRAAATGTAAQPASRPAPHPAKATGAKATGAKIPAANAAARPVHRAPGSVQGRDTEEITVSSAENAHSAGGGMMRVETAPHSVQTVTREYIANRNPTSSLLDLVKNLPSMNVLVPDSSGMEGGQVETHGMTDLDMAVTLDDAPAGQAKYLAELVDSENLDEVSVTPGSSGRDLPVMSSAAGVLNGVVRNPSHERGGAMDFSYGTNNLSREFLRMETGEIGNSGVRAYLSFSHTHARSWMGAGINERKHLDFGVRKDWENGSNARLFVSWNNADWIIDNYPTAQEFHHYKQTGEGWGRSADKQNLNYWKNSLDHWNQVFVSAPIHIVLPARLSLDVHPYMAFGKGWSASPDETVTDSATGATRNTLSYFQEHGDLDTGVVAKLGYDIDAHNHLSFGYWYNYSETDRNYPTAYAKDNGGAAGPSASKYLISAGDEQIAGYVMHALFIQDSARYLNDRLVIDGGFKFVMTNAWNRDDYGSLQTNRTAPMPQLSVSYNIDRHNQIYVNAEGDYRQPTENDMGWLYTNQQIPKNQYAIKEELGYRFHDDHVVVDLSLFNYNITNRIVDQYVGMNSFKPFSIGSQTIRGFDLMVSGREIYGFTPYASIEYLNARQDSNVYDTVREVMMDTKGKQAIMAPHVMANFGLTYRYKGFFITGTIHYTGPQSVAVDNSQRMPGYVTDTLALGYHFKPFFFLKSPTFRLNFANLTNSVVRTGPMGAVYSRYDTSTVHSGSLPAYTGYGNAFMVEPRFNMTGTISTSF